MLEFEDLIKKEVPSDDSTSVGEKLLLYGLIRALKPATIVETGTHKGLTTLYMAHAIYDEGYDGHIYTVDPYEWGAKANLDKIPELKDYTTYEQIRGDELEVDNVDFAFIDGFHEDFEVKSELDNLLPKLSKRAVVVFHDCWYGNTDGVNEALEKYGLKTIWLPTTNAIRIYSTHDDKPKS